VVASKVHIKHGYFQGIAGDGGGHALSSAHSVKSETVHEVTFEGGFDMRFENVDGGYKVFELFFPLSTGL